VRAPGPRHPRGGQAAGPPGGAGTGRRETGGTPPDSTVLVPEASGGTPPDLPGFGREELIRYARHFVLPQVGPEGQSRIKRARVLVVGAGGLGSPVALYLAAAGVGTLGVVDHDTVDLSNLQRQLLHGTSSLGRSKVASARERLREVNPHVQVIPHPVRLTSANAPGILAGYDLAVDGSDNFPTRYLLNDACVFQGKPYVYGAVDRWEGHVSVFAAPGGPCYRCLFREPPPAEMAPSSSESGILGVLPGVVGTLQATEALKLILGVGDPLVGRLLTFDALALSFREVRLRRNPGCPVCGDDPTQATLVDQDAFRGM
jgi:sulfur-carrier protein adenylyltransferase/sulfurtransferase